MHNGGRTGTLETQMRDAGCVRWMMWLFFFFFWFFFLGHCEFQKAKLRIISAGDGVGAKGVVQGCWGRQEQGQFL